MKQLELEVHELVVEESDALCPQEVEPASLGDIPIEDEEGRRSSCPSFESVSHAATGPFASDLGCDVAPRGLLR